MKNCEFLYREAKQKLVDLVETNKIPLDKICLSFSGGRDSTIMLHMIEDLGWKNKIKVAHFNTTMEFDATLEFVNKKIAEGWQIDITKPAKTMPQIYKEYGKPFHSKYTSEMINRLQRHGFNFKNDTYKDFNELILKYPKCKAALKWLTGHDRATLVCPKWVKRALVFNEIRIANKCCQFLKKKPAKDYEKQHNIILSIIGVRQSEGLSRKYTYKGCVWSDNKHFKFFPLLYFTDQDIKDLVEIKQIELSKAYTIYKQNRTGCVGCPFGKNHKEELEVLKKFEPKRAKIVEYLYKDIYDLDSFKKHKD